MLKPQKIPLKINESNSQHTNWNIARSKTCWLWSSEYFSPLCWGDLGQPQLSRRQSTELVFRSAGSPQRAFTSLGAVLWKTSTCLWVTDKHTDSPEACMHGTTFPVRELTAARKPLSTWSSLISSSSSWPLVAAICSWTMSSQSETDQSWLLAALQSKLGACSAKAAF